MFKKEFILPLVVLLFIIVIFFNKVFIRGFVPFPGDLLINHYSPWKFESYLGYNPASYPTKFQYHDVIRQLYPWKTFSIEQIKMGQMPLWNPYSFAGTPHAANWQSGVFSPFNILYFILSNIDAFSLGLILQIILAYIFTYLYSRKMGISQEGAILSSIAFSCSLFISTFFEYGVFGQTILWLPLILLGVEILLKELSAKGVLLVAGSFVAAAFGGHPQLYFYILLFIIAYSIVRLSSLRVPKGSRAAVIAFSILISVGISLLQILPFTELVSSASRVGHNPEFFLNNMLIKASELILIVSPDFYGNPASGNYLLSKSYPQTSFYIGVIPLIFAMSSLFVKKNNWVKFYIGASVAVLLLVTLNPITSLFYNFRIPLLSTSAPTNGIFLLSFSLAIISGFALDNWLRVKNKLPSFISLSLILFLLATFLIHRLLNAELSTKNILFSIALILAVFTSLVLSKVFRRKVFTYFFLLFTCLELFYFFQKFNPFVPRELVYPETQVTSFLKSAAEQNRVWGYRGANIEPNFSMNYSLFSPVGYDPLYPKTYGELIYADSRGLFDKFDNRTRSDAVLSEDSITNPDKSKILNLLGVKYIVDRVENGSDEKTFPGQRFKLVYENSGWKIFENRSAVPRFFLSSEYRVVKDKDEFVKNFFDADFDPSKTILLEESPEFASQTNENNSGSVDLINYSPNGVVFDVVADQPQLLFLSDMYFPGWKAYVDSTHTKIYRADHAFRAVVVPSGKHRVEFVYQPESFKKGVVVSVAGLFVLVLVSCIMYIKKPKYENK